MHLALQPVCANLRVLLLFALFVLSLASATHAQVVEVQSTSGCGGISGSTGWQNTGLVVTAGQTVSFCKGGYIQLNSESPTLTGPEGETAEGPAGPGWCVPEAYKGELLATSGGTIFRIGAADSITFDVGGAVQLGINDEFYDDNAGSFLVVLDEDQTPTGFTVTGTSTGVDFWMGLGRYVAGLGHVYTPGASGPATLMVSAPPAGGSRIAIAGEIAAAINNSSLNPCIRADATPPWDPPPAPAGYFEIYGPMNTLWFSAPAGTLLTCNTRSFGLPLPGYPYIGSCEFNPTVYQLDNDLLSFSSPTDAALLDGAASNIEDHPAPVLIASYDFEGAPCDQQGWGTNDLTLGFGDFARLGSSFNDLDSCKDNTSCVWEFSDPNEISCVNLYQNAIPSGPVNGEYLKNEIRSPLISLAAFPNVSAFRISYDVYRDMQKDALVTYYWRVRFEGPGLDGFWQGSGGLVGTDGWAQDIWTVAREVGATHMQIALGVEDNCDKWCGLYATASCHGPGPIFDNVKIEGLVATGPVITAADGSQAQDAFPTQLVAGPGGNYEPTADILGTAAFSSGRDIAAPGATHLVTGDSITVTVNDALGAGGIASVRFFASIVDGPHAGKAPAPHVVGANGFFEVPVETGAGHYFVDLDDDYFRGGDVVQYFWYATDGNGGSSSLPAGLTALPTSVVEAEMATQGLFEVDFLPTINWDPGYLARIAADSHGKLDPTPQEIANSSQRNCILYVQLIDPERRSSALHRTSLMSTLDKLGYKGDYDVYDHTGLASTWNHLATRAKEDQAAGYSLLVYDTGAQRTGVSMLPDGSDATVNKVEMSQWLQNWLAISGTPNAEHTLWMLGANVMQENPANPLFADMGATFVSGDQVQNWNPDVLGVANATNHLACMQNNTNDEFAVKGGCPDAKDYDALEAQGSGVVTHRYGFAGFPGNEGAVVMNANVAGYTTILQSFPWSDITAAMGQGPTTADETFMAKVLSCALPGACHESVDPTDVGDQVEPIDNLPRTTVLHQNVPNPLNPMTTIAFDLANEGNVSLEIYDVTGRLVRRLVERRHFEPGRYSFVWDGRYDSGVSSSAGIYFTSLRVHGGKTLTQKMVVVR
jgi:hypothetical protein